MPVLRELRALDALGVFLVVLLFLVSRRKEDGSAVAETRRADPS